VTPFITLADAMVASQEGSELPRIGLLGLGRMGQPMCLNLLRAGYTVAVNDLLAERVSAAVAGGATWVASAPELAAGADVLITMLPGPVEVETVMLASPGGPGALLALRRGATWIDMTTGSPTLARTIADQARAHGVSVLDAPVGGGPQAATAGTLQIFVGGDPGVMESHRALLAVLGDPDRIVHVGPSGTGCAAKLLVNLLWFGQAVANAEALMVADREGIDLEVFRGVVVAGSAASHFAEHEATELLAGDYLPAFSFARCCEELRTVRDLVDGYFLDLPVTHAVDSTYHRALREYGDVDGELLAVKFLEDANGITLRHPAHRRCPRPGSGSGSGDSSDAQPVEPGSG
jgi:3-hydroxyisobutyrate dehydrogenase